MPDLNQHTKEYLKYYLSLPVSVGFAVLLNGEWGCGKTWFIKRFISEYETLHPNELRFLYISLYGVTTTAEIEDQLFQQLHPILSSKPMRFTGKILQGILRASLKIDLSQNNFEGSASLSPDLKDFKVPDYLKNTDNSVIVFDDLERCRMDIATILGYINSFVEHQGLKVILIANETELDRSKDAEYRRIKEKLIGKTFRIIHDTESALDTFLKQLKIHTARRFLRGRKSEIAKIFDKAGYQNLRHLDRSFLDFERLFNTFSEKDKNLPGFLDDLLRVFLCLSFEIQAGKLTPSDIDRFMETAVGYAFNKNNNNAAGQPPLARLIEKYDLYDTSKLILPEQCWKDFFDKGFVSTAEISAAVGQTIFAQNESTPTWMKMWHYPYLNDDEFSGLLSQLSEQWQQKAFQIPEEILQVSGLFLRFSELSLYSKNLAETLQDCKNYLDEVSKSWTDVELQQHSQNRRHSSDSYRGLGYHGCDLDEFKELQKHLKDQVNKAVRDRLPAAGTELLKIMQSDPDKFVELVTLSNSPDRTFRENPVFEHVSPEEFVQALVALPTEQKRTITIGLKERYQFPDMSRHLVGEISFLAEVKTLLLDEIERRRGQLSGHIIERTVLSNVRTAIEMLQKHKLSSVTSETSYQEKH